MEVDATISTKALLIYAQEPTGIPYGEVPVQRLQRPAAADLGRSQHVSLRPVWKSNRELGYVAWTFMNLHAIESRRGHGDNVASMA